jgi:uncharacterized membrane protein YdbT with pleckstrin-like domain
MPQPFNSDVSTPERLLLKSKQHWAVFIIPVIPLAFAAATLALAVGTKDNSAFYCVSTAFALAGVADLVRTGVRFFTTDLYVTNRRVVLTKGLLQRHHIEILLHKVESIYVGKPLLGQLLDYGNLTIVGTGGTGEVVKSLASPDRVRNSINHLLELRTSQA